jgi:class 3 adenylate cyclase/tetratricopeptide (TPR) repeat protein
MEFHCPKCDSITPATGKFCKACGHNLSRPSESPPIDLSFDEKIDKIQRYLPKGLTEKILSQRDKIEGERKHVTVMFCDMEGFTSLSEKLGPEEAYSVMDKVYEILIHKVHEYEGTVNEMTGDGIMALFGAPVALEDAPQRAIRSAYAIHREMAKISDRIGQEKEDIPPLKMRIGIHTGPVVVGTLGNDLRVEFKAVGDTVNLASRMEGLADPGTTYVTEDSFRLTEGFFRFEALGEFEVKGKEGLVKTYRVIAPSTRRTRFDVNAERGLTPFVGRGRELELLMDGFERCKESRGQAFSIVAEAGVGKSRLSYEFRKAVINEDVTFLEGKCLSYSRGVAYHPIIDILKSNFDIGRGDGDFEITKKVKKGLELLKADEASTLPYLLELLSVKESSIDHTPMSSEMRKNRILDALSRIILKGSEIRPIIMAIEDLHWIDSSSEESLKHLLESISGARVFLIFTYRPEFVHTWGGRSYHSQVNLNRLSNRESLKMVAYLLGSGDIDRGLEALILEKTEGVPFFIEEFIKSLKNLEVIEREENKYYLTKETQDLTIPTTIQDVIMARVDSLPEEAKELLQAGSVIEREFGHKLIKHVLDFPEQQLLSSLSILKDSELLYERGIYPESTYIFKHALTREVVYESVLSKRRKTLHKVIGQAIEEIYIEKLEEFYEMLAYHYYEGEDWEKALDYLAKAGDKVITTYANQEALDYYALALEVCVKQGVQAPEMAIDLARKRGLVNSTIGDFKGAIEDFSHMRAEAHNLADRHLEGMALAYQGWAENRNYNMETVEDTLKAALAMANEDFEDVRLFASAQLGQFLLASNQYPEAMPFLRAAEELAPRVDDPYIQAWWSVIGTRWLLWEGRFKDALKIQAQFRDATRKVGETLLINSFVEAMALGGKGEYEKALTLLEDLLSTCKRIGEFPVRVRALNTVGWIYSELQDHHQAVEWNMRGVEAAREANFPNPEVESNARLNLGDNLLALGRVDEAEEQFQTVEQVVRNPRPQDYFLLWRYSQHLFHSYGELWLARNEIDKAIAYADECLALSEQNNSRKNIVKGRRLRGQVFLSKSKLAEAEEELSIALEIAQRIGNPTQLWKTYAVLGDLQQAQGRPDDAWRAYNDAISVIEEVAAGLKNESLRDAFMSSHQVQEIQQKTQRENGKTSSKQ